MKRIIAQVPMYHPLFILVCLLSVVSIYGQNSQNECYTISLDALKKIPSLYRQGKVETADSLLTAWEYQCGRKEFTSRFRTLRDIERSEFMEYDFSYTHYSNMFSYLEDERFRLLMDSVHENPRQLYLAYFSEPDALLTYTSFTQELATSIARKKNIDLTQPACDTETMLLQLYSGHLQTFLVSLKNEHCSSAISRFYASQRKDLEKKPRLDAAFFSGTWIPYGDMNLLGVHPSLGFLMGWGKRKMIYDFTFEFRFGRSKGNYQVMHQNALITTDHYFGGYMGAEVGYELKAYTRSKLYLLCGIAADGFDAIKSDTKNDVKGKSIFVLNVNAGVGWRIYSRDGSYVGIETRHHFVDYKNAGGTSLQGDAISVRILLGLFKNEMRARNLAQLNSIVN